MKKHASSLGRRIGIAVIVTALLMVGGPAAIVGQQIFGNIFGTVTDKSGAAVANAKITITDLGKNRTSVVMTNESGNYTKGQEVVLLLICQT
jgi:hypothetical protein